jgi:hypothetical protein
MMVQMGTAAGDSGPWIFLAKGQKIEIKPLKNLEENLDALLALLFSCSQGESNFLPKGHPMRPEQ